MFRKIRTAIVADASPMGRSQAAHALSDAGIELLAAVHSGSDALNALVNLQADLLVAGAQLPGMDGCILARRVLTGFGLPRRPAVIILQGRFPCTDVPEGALVLEKPLTQAVLCSALEGLQAVDSAFTRAELVRMDELLDTLGFPVHSGRECLKYAALICAADRACIHNLSAKVYPRAGECCGLSAAQAERAIRHAIGRAWQSDQFENQYRIFADTVDAGRGQPTCSEMISRLADILRLEG